MAYEVDCIPFQSLLLTTESYGFFNQALFVIL